MLMDIAKKLKGRRVMESCVRELPNNRIAHLWGLHGGHTLFVLQENKRFIYVEEVAASIGVVCRKIAA